jgi:ABC-type oligopeptide transport system ATPase subunit
MTALLDVKGLTKTFVAHGLFAARRSINAVQGLDFTIARGETLALVGESGSGKSTTGRMIMNLVERTSGDVLFDGETIFERNRQEAQALRRRMGIIFQDPYASLNPRKSVGHLLGQPLAIHKGGSPGRYRAEAIAMLDMVGLSPGDRFIDRYPHEFSGGQRQRIAIARALMLQPEFIVADEAVSALDVSVQAQILDLLTRLQRDLELTFLFITHDLAVVRAIAQRVAVMYRGTIVEMGPVQEVFDNPQHDYTRTLIASSPIPDPWLARRNASPDIAALSATPIQKVT